MGRKNKNVGVKNVNPYISGKRSPKKRGKSAAQQQ